MALKNKPQGGGCPNRTRFVTLEADLSEGNFSDIVTNDDKQVLANYNLRENEWSSGESDISTELAARIMRNMHAILPSASPQK